MRHDLKRRGAVLLALLLAALAGGYFYFRNGVEDEDGGYLTATVDRGPVAATVTATGAVEPVTIVKVGTYVSGPILAIDVDFNSPVTKGQRVAKIDPAPFEVKVKRSQANLRTSTAQIEKARADLELKRLTLERNRELRAGAFIAQTDLDTAKSEYDQATAELALAKAGAEQAAAELEEARINLAYTDITSPVDGVVVSRDVDVGQTVAASFQTPTLFEIAEDLTRMRVKTSVSESDIGPVRAGQPASFSVDAFAGRTFRGTVAQVRSAPVNVQNVVTYDVLIDVDNRDLELKPGMTATVTITTATREGVLRVPIRALSFRPPPAASPAAGVAATPAREIGEAVWRVPAGGDLEFVPIKTGLRDDAFVEVTGGDLGAGDEVAVGLRRSGAARDAPRIPGVPRYR